MYEDVQNYPCKNKTSLLLSQYNYEITTSTLSHLITVGRLCSQKLQRPLVALIVGGLQQPLSMTASTQIQLLVAITPNTDPIVDEHVIEYEPNMEYP